MITRDNAYESSPHDFVTEASSLGWKPGFWPQQLPTTLGNGRDLVRDSSPTVEGGDLIGWRYYQMLGCIRLTILND